MEHPFFNQQTKRIKSGRELPPRCVLSSDLWFTAWFAADRTACWYEWQARSKLRSPPSQHVPQFLTLNLIIAWRKRRGYALLSIKM
jgi:hypothetical protein